MAEIRTLTVDYGCTTEVLYVVGTQISINLSRSADPKAQFFSVAHSSNVDVKVPDGVWLSGEPSILPLNKDSVLYLSMKCASKEQGDGKVTIQLYDEKQLKLVAAELLLTAVEISLDVDADQDGVVEKNNPNKASWKWGPEGHGAILLVSCDSKTGKKPDNEKLYIASEEELKDMSLMVLRTAGPQELPKGYRLVLHMSEPDAQGARVFLSDKVDFYPLLLSSGKTSREVDYVKETAFYVQGVKFSDTDFTGLVQIHLSVLQAGAPETAVFTDTVQFKMAPWIMTPNTQPPLTVYACRVDGNEGFVQAMKDLVDKVGCELEIIPKKVNLDDPWAQDEMEFGYIKAPQYSFPVVLDSPRDRGMDNFPYNKLLGPDFGYVTREPPRTQVCSLDSFGNLDVSPPVTVNGKHYPLGRIYIGGAFPFQTDGRHMTNMVQEFLRAQVVQKPIALFSDWLTVGHVDEFMSFVPAKDQKGFRLLLASPHAAYKLFKRLQEEGYGQAKLFDGAPDKKVKRVTVDEFLANKSFHADNDYYQRCIDWNRDHLKVELGLDEKDIVDIPVLYELQENYGKKAAAYYPGIVNMIVLGKHLGIPKPYGPKVDGKCAIETEVTKLLEPLGLECNYIDDFVSYHEELGEVHCGSNTRRAAFNFSWWKMDM